jgi:Ca2+-binding EF-hand superfamily protein
MAIPGVGALSSAYTANSAASSAATSGQAQSSESASSSPSTIVTLSDGTTSTVVEADPSSLQATPLAQLWSPQMFVQGDQNQDTQIDEEEFGQQLARVGVSEDDAKKLFQTFDSSGDGKVSPEEFIQGIRNSLGSGSDLFKNLLNSYIDDASGKLDVAAFSAFMQKGQALAEQYVKQTGAARS